MYLYFDRSCLCANNMYNTANFHIRNLMTGLKKDPSLCTENEKSVMRTFGRAIPVINFSHRIKHFDKIYRICQDKDISEDLRKKKASKIKFVQFSMPTAKNWFASYGLLDAVFRYTDNADYRSFHSHVMQNAVSDSIRQNSVLILHDRIHDLVRAPSSEIANLQKILASVDILHQISHCGHSGPPQAVEGPDRQFQLLDGRFQ